MVNDLDDFHVLDLDLFMWLPLNHSYPPGRGGVQSVVALPDGDGWLLLGDKNVPVIVFHCCLRHLLSAIFESKILIKIRILFVIQTLRCIFSYFYCYLRSFLRYILLRRNFATVFIAGGMHSDVGTDMPVFRDDIIHVKPFLGAFRS